MKKLIFLVICLVLFSFIFVVSNYNSEEKDFFKDNNIEDTTPIGNIDGYWIYKNINNEMIKTLDYPTTPEGIKYARLTGR